MAWRLFVTCWLVYLLFLNPAGNLMSNTILGATVSLAQRQTWDVPLPFPEQAPDVAFVAMRHAGGVFIRSLSGLPPGASLVAVPCYVIAWWAWRLLPEAWARSTLFTIDPAVLIAAGLPVTEAFRFVTPPFIYWLQLVAAALVSTTAAAGTVALCEVVLRRLQAPPWQRLVSCAVLGFGTTLFPHALTYGKDPLAAFFAFAAFAGVCTAASTAQEIPRHRFVIAGYLAGIAVAIDYWAAVVGLLLLCYAGHRFGWRAVTSLLTGMALPLAALALYHATLFGAPWNTPYRFRALGAIAGHQVGLAGLTGLNPVALWGLSFSPFQGVFIYHAFLLACLPAVWMRRRLGDGPELALSLAVLLGLLFTAALSGHLLMWSGAFIGWGPRRLVLAAPFMALLFAGCLRRLQAPLLRAGLMALGMVSIAVQLVGAAWGGTLFPDPRAAALVLVSHPDAAAINPLATMLKTVVQRGLSAPLFRIYGLSDAAAMWATAGALAALGLVCWRLWAPSRRKKEFVIK